MFKVNNKDTRTTIFIVNSEHVIAGWVATIKRAECVKLTK